RRCSPSVRRFHGFQNAISFGKEHNRCHRVPSCPLGRWIGRYLDCGLGLWRCEILEGG
ncbi:hypothetical protein ACJX0J_005476, partial [Zea mays]